MGQNDFFSMTSSHGSNSAGRAVALSSVNIQIICKMYTGSQPAIAKRRFVYCWERKKDGSWNNIGLTITDDFGILCNLGKIIEDLENAVKRKTNVDYIPLSQLQVNAFDREKKEWKKRPWAFFGETEDVVTFQKWLGEYIFSTEEYIEEQRKYYKYNRYFNNTFDYDEFVFNRPFYSLEKYRLEFNPANEYVFTFCPPDIINTYQPTSVPEQKGSISFSSFQNGAILFGSGSRPELKFWDEPHLCWTGKYVTKSDDTIGSIAQRFGMEDWNDLYQANKSAIGSDPKKIAVGTELKIPQTDDALFFGCMFSIGNIEHSNADGELSFCANQFSAHINKPFISINLPVNLEEYLSLLSYHTLLFDMEYAEIIRSMEGYGEAGYKLQQISFFLNLMKRYPGFDDGNFSDSEVKYYLDNREEPGISDSNMESLDSLIQECEKLAEDIGKSACSDENTAYAREKKELKNVLMLLKKIFEEPLFQKRVEQWKIWNEHIYKYNKNDRISALVPFSLRAIIEENKNEFYPIIYPCISKAACTILLYGKIQKNEKTVEDFYMKNVRPLERELEIAFIKSDILDNKKLAKKLNELGKDKFKDFLSVDDWYKKASLVNYDMYSEPSVLSYIFNDLLLKSVLPGLWNTQTGPASFLDTILQIATVHRYDFAISRILITNRLSLASSFIKIELGRLRYFTDSSDEIADALEEAFKRAIKEKRNLTKIQRFDFDKGAFKGKLKDIDNGTSNLGKSKLLISKITSSLQIVISLYDLFQFVEKYGNEITSETEFKKDFYNLYKSIHSGVTATTGFNLNMVNKYPKLERIFRNGARVLRFGSALAMFIDAYLLYQESEEAKVLGEEFIVGMRTTQAVISGSAGVYLFLTLCTPLPFVPAIAGLVGLTLLVLSIVEWVHEYNLRGTKKVIQQLRDEINRSRFIKGDIIFKSEGKNYAFFAVSYLNAYNNGKFEKAEYSQSLDNLKWTNPYQRYDNVIDKKYIERWNAIANKIGQQNYWNLEIIPAGREMKEKGFTDNTIAFVAMKRSNLTTLEKRKISGEPYRYEINKIENYPSHAYGAMYSGMGYTGYGYSGFKMVYNLK